MIERANKVISKFGLENQIKKFNEESYELQEVLIKANALLLISDIDGLTHFVDNVFEQYTENEIFKNLEEVKKYLEECYYE